MHVGRTNTHSKYYMNNVQLGITKEEKDLGVVVVDDLMVAQHCAYAYSKANRTLGMIGRPIQSRDVGIMLSLYKTLVRPHLKYCSSSWSPHYQKDKKTPGESSTPFHQNDSGSKKSMLRRKTAKAWFVDA